MLRADPEMAARAANLAARETGCCFDLTCGLTVFEGTVLMTVSTGSAHEDVLAALGARAQAKLGAGE